MRAVNFPKYSIARASIRLDEKKIGNSSKRLSKDLPKNIWSLREMEQNKQKSEIGDITIDKCTRSDMLLPDKKSTVVATRSVQLSPSVLLS